MSEKKKGFWDKLFGSKDSGGCCNMEIIEEAETGAGCCSCCSPKAPAKEQANGYSSVVEDLDSNNKLK